MTKQLSIESTPLTGTSNNATSTSSTIKLSGLYECGTTTTQLMNESTNTLLTSFLHDNYSPSIITPRTAIPSGTTIEANTMRIIKKPLCTTTKQQHHYHQQQRQQQQLQQQKQQSTKEADGNCITTLSSTSSTVINSTTANNITVQTSITPAKLIPTPTPIPTPISTPSLTATPVTTSSLAGREITTNATTKTSTLLTNIRSSYSLSSSEANSRSAALERAYVHDVYENCEEKTGSLRPRVVQFLSNLEPGSVVCDVGCGNGRYLTQCNPNICTVGADRCYRLSRLAKEKGGEVVVCDNLELPFRNESFDAVLSLAVIHHFATTDRRVNALRELARILRIGGRVIITVWALEQKHRRFESQDVLVPWQPPKMRSVNYSDEDEDDDFIAPYHAYIEDSTSSRSTGEGDSSSLSSSSPGESCYTFVKRAIQKLAIGRKHTWFLESWTSKDTQKDSSFECEDAKDLPIELRRLEDFEDFKEPSLATTLKSRSLSNISNSPQQQIVRSRSSVPSLYCNVIPLDKSSSYSCLSNTDTTVYTSTESATTTVVNQTNCTSTSKYTTTTTIIANKSSSVTSPLTTTSPSSLNTNRRPKLIKQKQSLCDEDFQLPDVPFQMLSKHNSNNNRVTHTLCTNSQFSSSNLNHLNHAAQDLTQTSKISSALLSRQVRKQSSLNEELMAGNRLREKERLRKRIQKQHSLNEAFLCRSAMFSKKLQIIREGFTSRIKSSSGNLERVTKSGFTKILQNLKTPNEEKTETMKSNNHLKESTNASTCIHEHHHHSNHHSSYQPQMQTEHQAPHQKVQGHFPFVSNFQNHLHNLLHKQTQFGSIIATNKFTGPVTICRGINCVATACYCTAYHQGCSQCNAPDGDEEKARRQSRESGSDSSKENSLQSDTSIESEDSFASVIYIPNPEQHQQQLNYQTQHQNSNSSSSNSSSSNGGSAAGKRHTISCNQHKNNSSLISSNQSSCKMERISSLPTSPLIMPCPPTPAHSPATVQIAITSPPQIVGAVSAAMAILTPLPNPLKETGETSLEKLLNEPHENHFNFNETHIKQQSNNQLKQLSQEKGNEQPQHKEEEMKATSPIPMNHDLKIACSDLGNNMKQEMKSPQQREKTLEQSDRQEYKQNHKSSNRITHQTIKDLPPIPKFRRQQTIQLCKQTFPIVRRSSAATGAAIRSIPKLLSLEIYNPATDDLDSDSSEPSSPDSVDSVISAPKTNIVSGTTSLDQTKEDSPLDKQSEMITTSETTTSENPKNEVNDTSIPENISGMVNKDNQSDIMPKVYQFYNKCEPQNCSEFAEQLNAQLNRQMSGRTDDPDHYNSSTITLEDVKQEDFDDPFSSNRRKKYSGRDLIAIRDELRERRLLLANLSNQTSLNQSPTSSSTSSLSSQTRSFTIHEEDEDDDEEENERSYSMQLYENYKLSKFNSKRQSKLNLHSETTYLLQDEDLTNRAEENDHANDNVNNNDDDSDNNTTNYNFLSEESKRKTLNSISINNKAKFSESTSQSNDNTIKPNSTEEGYKAIQNQQKDNRISETNKMKQSHLGMTMKKHPCTQSSSSTESLESPTQGGATTHHRYYHVFREGELDALINYHVSNLHIVSSYYERASWCVVAEKVQVWTI